VLSANCPLTTFTTTTIAMNCSHLGASTLLLFVAILGFASPQGLKIDASTDPNNFEIGTDATIFCRFTPMDTNITYEAKWSSKVDDGSGFKEVSIVKVKSVPETGYPNYYLTADKKIFGRMVSSGETLTDGVLKATIKNITISDGIDYVCSVENGVYSDTATVDVTVYKLPTEVFIEDVNTDFSLLEIAEIEDEPMAEPEDTTDFPDEDSTAQPDDTTDLPEVTTQEDEEKVIARCVAKGVYPKPQGLTFEGVGDHKQYNAVMDVVENANGLFDATAELKFIPGKETHNQQYTCFLTMGIDLSLDGNYDTKYSSNYTSKIMVTHDTESVKFTISKSPAKEDDWVVMTCQGDGYPINQISIEKEGGEIVKEETRDPLKTKLVHRFKADRNSGGSYKCLVNEVEDVEELVVEWLSDDLEILRDGEAFSGSEIILSEGEDLDLKCSTTGHPTPQMRWKSNKLPGSIVRGGFLSLQKVTYKESGDYECSVKAHHLSKTITVKVLGACDPQLTVVTRTAADNEDDMLIAKCVTSGNPVCSVVLATSADLGVDPKITEKKGEVEHRYTEYTKLDKFPEFTCTATSSQGEQVKKFVLEEPEVLHVNASGMNAGVTVVIVLVVILIATGLMYGVYRWRQGSAVKGHTKGSQIDSVEAEKLEAGDENLA